MAANEKRTENDDVKFKSIDGNSIKDELESKGYCVIPDVVNESVCDTYIQEYKDWLQYFGDGSWPSNFRSIIYDYKVPYFKSTWEARLAALPIFSHIWGTNKLLSSTDGVSISEPPGEKKYKYRFEDDEWLHIDQSPPRLGMHAYQGAVYLEETSEKDYCFRVIEGSHKYYKELFDTRRFDNWFSCDYAKMGEFGIEWLRKKGCEQKFVPVPKGGMVVWDSRLAHDAIKPHPDTNHKDDRWRFVVFVCMTPAIWADEEAIRDKRRAYRRHFATGHWPSQNINVIEGYTDVMNSDIAMLTRDPSFQEKDTIRKLAGADVYDFKDGQSNGPDWTPEWQKMEFNM